MWKTRVQLDNESLGVHLQPGDEVPAALIEMSPWVVDEGLVVEAQVYDLEQSPPAEDVIIPAPEVTEDTISAELDEVNENPTAYEAVEDEFSGEAVPSDPSEEEVAPSGSEEA